MNLEASALSWEQKHALLASVEREVGQGPYDALIARHGEDGVVEMVLQAASSSATPPPQPSRARKVKRVLGWAIFVLLIIIVVPSKYLLEGVGAWIMYVVLPALFCALVSSLWDKICNWFREITTVRY